VLASACPAPHVAAPGNANAPETIRDLRNSMVRYLRQDGSVTRRFEAWQALRHDFCAQMRRVGVSSACLPPTVYADSL